MAIQCYHLERANNPLRKTALSFSCLAKLGAVTWADLCECRHLLRAMIERSAHDSPISGPILIVGLVESGVILSALMHQEAQRLGFETFWICSTRRPASGVQVVEHHSHAPGHILPLPDASIDEVWIVEDEITTGRTIAQAALMLIEALRVPRVRIFALADTRTPPQQQWLQETLASARTWLSVQCLFRFTNLVSESERCEPALPAACPPLPVVPTHPATSTDCWHLGHLRPALQMQRGAFLRSRQPLSGDLLVIGEAMDLAIRMARHNPRLTLRHVTLSPWQIDNKHIFDCLHVDPHYYLYNLSSTGAPLAILGDPIDMDTTNLLHAMLAAKGYDVRIIVPGGG